MKILWDLMSVFVLNDMADNCGWPPLGAGNLLLACISVRSR